MGERGMNTEHEKMEEYQLYKQHLQVSKTSDEISRIYKSCFKHPTRSLSSHERNKLYVSYCKR